MSSGESSEEIQGDPHIQSHPSANNIERQTSMSVGYLTRIPQSREPPYDINSGYIYSSQPLMQQQNMQQQQQHREAYDRPPSGASHHASSIRSTSSSSPRAAGQQTPRITLPPLSAITETQQAQNEGSNGQSSQPPPASPAQTAYPSQHQQPPQSTPPYATRPPPQYEQQPGAYSHPSRQSQPSGQVSQEQTRYSSNPNIPAPQVPVLPHQMSVGQLQQPQQMGQFPPQSQVPGQYTPQSQYGYQQGPQYPPQTMYGQYPPMPTQMPPGIPYQPAYATSHRQRPPQFTPYPSPSGFVQPPQGAPAGWPQQDYIAQPLTPLTSHSPQQPYSPQIQQMPGPGGPMRIRRTSSGLSQSAYPPPGEPPQPPPQQQPALKPKRKRATSGQLRVLNSVFASTFFPSTELRVALGKELNMSPRTVQIWFQNKRQSWRAQKAKMEHVSTTQSGGAGTPTSSQLGPSGSYSPHPLRQEAFTASPTHGRMPSTADENTREEGMENDEGGGWEALRQAQQGNRDYRPSMSGVPDHDDDDGFDDDENGPHQRHR